MKIVKTLCITVFFVLLISAVALVGPVQAVQNVKVGGMLQADVFGANKDLSNGHRTDSFSDIKLDELDLSVSADLNEHVSANTVVKYEYEDPAYQIVVDEAYITLTKLLDQPITVTAGKWYLPFGVFNNHLINDPLTEDAFEINAPGVSLAFTPADIQGLDFLKGLNLSATLYSNHGDGVKFEDPNNNDLGNYILNATIKPVDFVECSVYFDSQMGLNNDHNDSLGASLSATYFGVTLDAEYIAALQRDAQYADRKHHKPTAYSVAAAYHVLPAVELAARYEGYDDDTGDNEPYDPDTLEGLEYRVSAGVNYDLYENTKLMAEYRVSELEKSNESTLNEWALRLAVEF